MINIIVENNLVRVPKESNKDSYKIFADNFLTKYEEVLKIDPFGSTKYKKKFKSVKDKRKLYTEDKEFIYFSRGLLEFIPKNILNIDDRSYTTLTDLDDINTEEIKHSLPIFDLRDDQVIAVNKCLKLKRGVIQLPTATGKSAIISSTIKNILKYNPKANILVLAPTLSTVSNIYDTLIECGIKAKMFNKSKSIDEQVVTTSLVQSLISESKKNPHLLDDINCVFYDECLPRDSKILLPNGEYTTIEEVYDNDNIKEVLSFNLETQTYEVKEILRKFKTPFDEKFSKVYFKHPLTNKLEGLTCTKNHKIYVKNKNGYIPTIDLSIGDLIKIDIPSVRNNKIFERATYVRVEKVVHNIGRTREYKFNIEVKDNHNYFANDVLVSNCHHLKCDTWNQLNKLLKNVEYSLGFSALSIDKSEIYETDIRNLSFNSALIAGCSGKVIMHMDPSYYIENHIIATPVIFQINHHNVLPDGFDETNWSGLVKIGLMSTPRSIKIANISSMFAKYNRKVLILVSEKEHAFTLGKYLRDIGETKFGISFGADEGYIYSECGNTNINEVNYNRIGSLEVIDLLSKGNINIVIASCHLDEGVNLNKLDSVILAGGGKQPRRIIQRVGRVLRKSKTGKYAYIVDFTDTGSRVLHRQSNQRIEMYQETLGTDKNHLFNNLDIDKVEILFKQLEEL